MHFEVMKILGVRMKTVHLDEAILKERSERLFGSIMHTRQQALSRGEKLSSPFRIAADKLFAAVQELITPYASSRSGPAETLNAFNKLIRETHETELMHFSIDRFDVDFQRMRDLSRVIYVHAPAMNVKERADSEIKAERALNDILDAAMLYATGSGKFEGIPDTMVDLFVEKARNYINENKGVVLKFAGKGDADPEPKV